jgi:hypothetical protein
MWLDTDSFATSTIISAPKVQAHAFKMGAMIHFSTRRLARLYSENRCASSMSAAGPHANTIAPSLVVVSAAVSKIGGCVGRPGTSWRVVNTHWKHSAGRASKTNTRHMFVLWRWS